MLADFEYLRRRVGGFGDGLLLCGDHRTQLSRTSRCSSGSPPHTPMFGHERVLGPLKERAKEYVPCSARSKVTARMCCAAGPSVVPPRTRSRSNSAGCRHPGRSHVHRIGQGSRRVTLSVFLPTSRLPTTCDGGVHPARIRSGRRSTRCGRLARQRQPFLRSISASKPRTYAPIRRRDSTRENRCANRAQNAVNPADHSSTSDCKSVINHHKCTNDHKLSLQYWNVFVNSDA